MDLYKTIYQGDFLWPYLVPIYERPAQPPRELKKPIYIQEKSILERKMCQCDRHSWSPHFRRAVHLLQKENAYRDAMLAIAHQRTVLENEILDHPCSDADDVIASLYELSYAKQNFPVTGFRAVHADHDDPVSTPIAMLRPTIASNYRDPTTFVQESFKIPTTSSPAILTLELDERKPPPPPKTEYQDTFERMAWYNISKSQGFKEPATSTKMKPECFCVK